MGYPYEYYIGNSKGVHLLELYLFLHVQLFINSLFTCDGSRSECLLHHCCSLAYLHEGLEPKVVHRDVKSGNILLDRQWNSKVSDFGLAKLLCSERSYVTTRVMGTFGLVNFHFAVLHVFVSFFFLIKINHYECLHVH